MPRPRGRISRAGKGSSGQGLGERSAGVFSTWRKRTSNSSCCGKHSWVQLLRRPPEERSRSCWCFKGFADNETAGKPPGVLLMFDRRPNVGQRFVKTYADLLRHRTNSKRE